jgi:hypothetical protein
VLKTSQAAAATAKKQKYIGKNIHQKKRSMDEDLDDDTKSQRSWLQLRQQSHLFPDNTSTANSSNNSVASSFNHHGNINKRRPSDATIESIGSLPHLNHFKSSIGNNKPHRSSDTPDNTLNSNNVNDKPISVFSEEHMAFQQRRQAKKVLAQQYQLQKQQKRVLQTYNYNNVSLNNMTGDNAANSVKGTGMMSNAKGKVNRPLSKSKSSINQSADMTTSNSLPDLAINAAAIADESLYDIKAVFEKDTTYLKIPFSHFERILDDEKLIVRSMADGKIKD